MNKTPKNEKGFGLVGVLMVIMVVILASGVGVYIWHEDRHDTKSSNALGASQNSSQQSSKLPTKTTPQYLAIKEWGVKLPLSSAINDAYYVVSTSTSNDPDGLPSEVWLGLRSLMSQSCNPVNNNSGGAASIGGILRVLPTATDPVSGKLYTQLDPNGATVGNYYYAYTSWTNDPNNKCPQSSMKAANSAFTTVARGIVADTFIKAIPELGVEIVVPSSIKDLVYITHKVTLANDNSATYAMFSTSSLTALDSSCSTSFGPLGSLERGGGQYHTSSNDPLDYGVLVKQFPTFYISADFPQGACSQSNSANGLASSQKTIFGNAETTITQLK